MKYNYINIKTLKTIIHKFYDNIINKNKYYEMR